MPMGTNIKMSLMPKGINKIIYNPGVSFSTPEYVLIPYPFSALGVLFFSSVRLDDDGKWNFISQQNQWNKQPAQPTNNRKESQGLHHLEA